MILNLVVLLLKKNLMLSRYNLTFLILNKKIKVNYINRD